MKKENLPLLIGICIPVLMIIFVAVSIYLPQFFVHPGYDFLYVTSSNRYYISSPSYRERSIYEVRDGQLVENEFSEILDESDEENAQIKQDKRRYDEKKEKTQLFRYDVETDTNTELSFEEAQKLTLNSGPISPDGFELEYSYGDYNIFSDIFGGGRSSGYVLKKADGWGKKIELHQGDRYYYRGFDFLGWIEE